MARCKTPTCKRKLINEVERAIGFCSRCEVKQPVTRRAIQDIIKEEFPESRSK